MTPTNKTRRDVLQFFLDEGIFAFPVTTQGVQREGRWTGASKVGIPDLLFYLPGGARGGFIDIKTGKDKPRVEQLGAMQNLVYMGGIGMFIRDFKDFKKQWDDLLASGKIKYARAKAIKVKAAEVAAS